jgi:hypothetical protein
MEEFNWCLGIGEQITDYMLCEWDLDTLPELTKQDEVRFQYNQWAWSWSQVSCTIFAAAWMLSDLKNYEFSEAQLKEMDELSYTRGRIRGQWWYVQSAVKCVADRWNESDLSKKHWKVAYFRIGKYDNDIIQWALDKNYTLDTNYNGNSKYNQDYKADWILDGTDFWASTYGHSIGVINQNWKNCIKDNYYGRKYNIYELKNKIGDIKCYGSFLYIYTNVENLEEIKRLNEFKTLLQNTIELNSQLWHKTNDKNYQSILHYMNEKNRKKIEDIEVELRKYI